MSKKQDELSDAMTRSEVKSSAVRGLGSVTRSQQVALVAMFAAIISVCAVAPAITVGAIPTPITLQTFGVMLTAMILGPRLAPLAVGLYLVIGALGLPVFAKGASGLAVFAGPTAGYLLSFPILAWAIAVVFGKLTHSFARATQMTKAGNSASLRTAWWRAPQVLITVASCLLASYLTTHLMGIAGMILRVPMSAHDAFLADAIFLPGDLVKTSAATLVALAVLRGFPQLKQVSDQSLKAAPVSSSQTRIGAHR